MSDHSIARSVARLAGLAGLGLGLQTALPAHAAEPSFPGAAWQVSSPEAEGMRSAKLADMLERVRGMRYRIDSVTVVRNGRLVLDAYAYPYRKGLKHPVHSVTKSVTSTLVGIAIGQRRLAGVDKPVLGFFPGRKVARVDAAKRAMTVEHLLTMRTGFDCRDSWKHKWVGLAEMYRSDDWTGTVLDRPMRAAPGGAFNYCSGASFLLGAILTRTLNTDLRAYARAHLFGPIGIGEVTWPTSPRGIATGYGRIRMTPHDMARLGWLYANGGRWAGRQVVPAAWVKRATRAHVKADLFDHYGYQWWGDRRGYYMAVGYRGQYIFVVPAKQLVAVVTADLGKHTMRVPQTMLDRYIVPAAVSGTPLAADTKGQARLKALAASMARPPAKGYVWGAPEEGQLRNDVFVRTAAPAFRLEVPPGSRRADSASATEVMRVRALSGAVISASVLNRPAGLTLARAGPAAIAGRLRRYGTGVRVISNEAVELADGTPAYRTEIRWLKNGFPVRTVALSTFRGGKWVLLTAHGWVGRKTIGASFGSLSFAAAR